MSSATSGMSSAMTGATNGATSGTSSATGATSGMTGAATTETPSRPNVRFRQVGRPLTRTDAPGKVAGRTPYAGDYTMPNMLHMRVVRADVASARLVRLDVSKARALEGGRLRAHRRRPPRPHRVHRHSGPGRPQAPRHRPADPGQGAGAVLRGAAGPHRGGDPRRRGPRPGAGGGRAGARSRRLRSDGGDAARRPRRHRARQRRRGAQDPEGRRGGGLRRGRRHRREHLPDPRSRSTPSSSPRWGSPGSTRTTWSTSASPPR